MCRTLLSDAFDPDLAFDLDFALARVGTDAFLRPPLTLFLILILTSPGKARLQEPALRVCDFFGALGSGRGYKKA